MPNEHITVDTLAFAPATRELIEPVLECVNDAFIADAFFKKPAYVNRMSLADIRDAVLDNLDEGKSETYFAATHTDAATGALTVVGAVHLKWGVRKDDTPGVITVHGTFSVVAVGTAYRERGFGKYLIRSVESFLLSEAKRAAESAAELAARSTQQAAAERVRCESGALVLDVRTELPPWYARQGYATVETGLPFPYPEMLNEQYSNVTGMRILKVLSDDVAATA